MLINASVVLNFLIRVSPYRPSHYQEVSFEVDTNVYSGFIMTVTNRIEIRHETCSILDSLLTLEINGEKFKFGCLHYWVHYFESPVGIRFLPALLASLSDSVTVVLTAVRFACPPFHARFRQCPNHPVFCISRELFCDNIDNCGFHSDEADCTAQLHQVSVVITDERYPATHIALISVSFCFGILLLIIVMFIIYRIYKGRKRKYCTIKSLFGAMKPLKPESAEPEETVALLTLGLKTFLPHSSNNNYPPLASNYGTRRASRQSLRFNRL